MKFKKNIYNYIFYNEIGERNKAKKYMTHEKVIADYKWIRICKLIPPDFALYYVIINSKLINDPLLELGAWRSFWGFNTWKYWLEKENYSASLK